MINPTNELKRHLPKSQKELGFQSFGENIESELVNSSKKMRQILQLINKLSLINTTVLIRGESGTGKGLAARMIHQNSSRKRSKFIAINCAAIPPSLIKSELFGHEKGAFTDATEKKMGLFQLANEGTLFLDEIGELSLDLQIKLSHVLGNKKFLPVGANREIQFNARIIAATNCNLEMMIENKTFRKDLFYHLNIMPIFMPPLRERTDDLKGLIKHILKKKDFLHRIEGIQPDTLEILKSYNWPGNIRELENIIEKAVIIEDSGFITLDSIPKNIRQHGMGYVEIDLPSKYIGPLDFDVFKTKSEKEFIICALKMTHGRINQTVIKANIPKNTLLRKIKKYKIDVKKYH